MENLLKYVKNTKTEGAPLGDDPVIQQTAMSAYIDSHVDGLLNTRNLGMYRARQEMSYEGSQTLMFGKVYRIKNADRSREVMGMYSLCGSAEPRAPFGGQPELYQRSSLVGAHPAGTIEIQKVIIARRIGISRTRERAAATPSTAGVSGV
jgi:alkylation response protein AidB-like acyl-CoA dehydrogenase